MSKYKMPVMITTTASKFIGYVECDGVEDYHDKAEELWDSLDNESPTTNISNDFELGDFDIAKIDNFDLASYPAKDNS